MKLPHTVLGALRPARRAREARLGFSGAIGVHYLDFLMPPDQAQRTEALLARAFPGATIDWTRVQLVYPDGRRVPFQFGFYRERPREGEVFVIASYAPDAQAQDAISTCDRVNFDYPYQSAGLAPPSGPAPAWPRHRHAHLGQPPARRVQRQAAHWRVRAARDQQRPRRERWWRVGLQRRRWRPRSAPLASARALRGGRLQGRAPGRARRGDAGDLASLNGR